MKKKQKYDQKMKKQMKIMTKMLQKRKVYRTWKFTAYKKTFFPVRQIWTADDNKMAIGKISIGAIQKLSYFDQQTIVGGLIFSLTNGIFSSIDFLFFRKKHFCKKTPCCFNFNWFCKYFDQNYVCFCIFYWR